MEQPAGPYRSQNAHFPLRRDMAGEERESSLASLETGASAEYILLEPLSRSIGRPGESPERHQWDDYGMKVLQIVLRVASKLVLQCSDQKTGRVNRGYHQLSGAEWEKRPGQRKRPDISLQHAGQRKRPHHPASAPLSLRFMADANAPYQHVGHVVPDSWWNLDQVGSFALLWLRLSGNSETMNNPASLILCDVPVFSRSSIEI
jgi:hypothetical protein